MSPELEAAIERMRNHVMTPEEKFEQRVSFVYGQQDHDKPGKSKDEIRQMLIDSTGYPPCQKCAALEAAQPQEAVRKSSLVRAWKVLDDILNSRGWEWAHILRNYRDAGKPGEVGNGKGTPNGQG